MGQNSSNQIDEQNKLLHQNLRSLNVQNQQEFRFVQKRDDESIIIQNIQKHKYYLLRILTVAAEQDCLSIGRLLEKRNKIQCIHLSQIIAVKKQHQSLSCSEIYKIHLLIECPIKSLKQELQQRGKTSRTNPKKRFFHESQLWGIMYSVVKALKSLYLYGIIHQSLSLQAILIDQKGLIKLADPAIFGLQKNYVVAMKQKQECQKILSPELLIFLEEYNFYFYEKQKSDIFILGILILQLSILHKIQTYDYKGKRARFQLIQSNLMGIKSKYSQKFCSALEWMTQIEPKKRPRLGELMDFIDTNNSEGSTNLSNTGYNTPTQVPTVIVQRNLIRDKTVSAFSIDTKYNFQNPLFLAPQNKAVSQNKAAPLNKAVALSNNLSNNLNYMRQNYFDGQKKDFIKQRNDTEESKNVFPFELVYNKVINNNENMRRFEVQNLYKQFKNTDMFGSSCRGSVPSSSHHAQIQKSKQIPNKNFKQQDLMGFSKNSVSKGQNLIYSHSSVFNGSNKLSFSQNSLADIQLVESSHIKETFEYKCNVREQISKPVSSMDDIAEQNSVQSPYRRLGSLKSGEGKSLTYLRILDIEPIVFKEGSQFNHSSFLQTYHEQNKSKNYEHADLNLQNRYFSQQKQRQLTGKRQAGIFQEYKSELLKSQTISSTHPAQNKSKDTRLQQKYDRYLLEDQVITKYKQNFQSSELQSKLSRITPNFAEKSESGNQQNGSQNQSMKDDPFLQQNLLYVQNDVSEEGDVYNGYTNKLGLKERHGKLQFHDGGYYEGQWKNDKMQGYGQMYYSNGQLAYKGLWKEGSFNGKGHIFNDTPQQFDDSFNFRDFSEIDDKWLSYEGQFENDAKHGKGKINLTNKQFFQGTFDYDMIDGYGTFHTKNGQTIKGLWRDNQLAQYN